MFISLFRSRIRINSSSTIGSLQLAATTTTTTATTGRSFSSSSSLLPSVSALVPSTLQRPSSYCTSSNNSSNGFTVISSCHHPRSTMSSPTTTTTTKRSTSSSSSCTFKTTPDICDDLLDSMDDNTSQDNSDNNNNLFRCQVVDPTLGLQNVGSTSMSHFGGQIVTVKCHEDNSIIKFLSLSSNDSNTTMDGTGKVLVVDGGGSTRRALMGDQVAEGLARNGWNGIVIWGCVRDIEQLRTMDESFGMYAIGTNPLKTSKRNEGQMNTTIQFGGVTFVPGHWIVCDDNGIVVSDIDPRTLA